jgi:hypothetical protein
MFGRGSCLCVPSLGYELLRFNSSWSIERGWLWAKLSLLSEEKSHLCEHSFMWVSLGDTGMLSSWSNGFIRSFIAISLSLGYRHGVLGEDGVTWRGLWGGLWGAESD